MSEEVVIKVDLQGDGSVDKLNKKLDQTGEYSEKATSEIGRLRRELRDAKSDMLKYAEGTEQYNKALRRAAEIQGRVRETNDIVKAGVRDLGATTKLVAGTINGLAGGFQVAQGAMALFGVENDAVLKTMMQMQALMSITSGIAGFADGFDNLQDLMAGFKAEAAGAKDAVSELSNVSGKAADNMGNLAKEGAVIGSNLAGTSGAVDKLANAVDGVGKVATASKESIEAHKRAIDEWIQADIKAQTTMSEVDALEAKYARDNVNRTQAAVNASRELAQSELNQAKAKNDSTKATEKATGGFLKQIGTMGLWIAAITAATYALSWLIEKINEVPKDLEVKIDIETSALAGTQKYLETIKEIQNQQRLLSSERIKNSNKETTIIKNNIVELLNSIRDGAGEEYKIAKNKDRWLAEFAKTENERQRKLAYNKVLFSKQANAQIAIAQEEQKQKEIITSIAKQLYDEGKNEEYVKNFVNSWKRGSMEASTVVAHGLTGEVKLWNESIDKIKEVKEDNKTLLSLKPYDVYDITKSKGSGGSGSKSTYSKASLKDNPEVVQAEMVARERIAWKEFETIEKTKLEQEQIDISNEIANRKIPITGGELNVFEQLVYDIRLTQAALADAEAELGKLTNRKQELEGYKSLFEEEAKNVEIIYDTIDKTNVSLAEKQTQLNVLLEKEKELEAIYNKSKNAGEAKKNKEAVDSIKVLITAKQEEIETDKNQLKILEKGLTDAKERQAQYKAGSDEYKQIQSEIISLNNQIAQSNEDLHNSEVSKWREKINLAGEYLDALSSLAGGFADIAQGNMDLTNAEYDQKIWANDEMIQSDKQRADKAYQIEMQRWEALKENFEMQKKMKEAQAWMDFASGSVGIWTAPGITSLAPFGYILAGIQQAALLATTIGNVKSIQSQQMLKPHKPGSGSSGGASSANIALNPAKDALTSRDENLNTMAKANQNEVQTNVVRVTDINDVQSKVKVREQNSSY